MPSFCSFVRVWIKERFISIVVYAWSNASKTGISLQYRRRWLFVHGPDEYLSDTCYYAQQEFLVDSVEVLGDGVNEISPHGRFLFNLVVCMVDKIIQRSWYSPGCSQLYEVETDVSNHFFFFFLSRLRGKFQRDSEFFFFSLSLSPVPTSSPNAFSSRTE